MQFIQSGKHDWTQNELLKKWDDLNQGKNIGLRMIIEKETGAIIGECGFLKLNAVNPDLIEIGYMIHQDYWQKGYGSEIVQTLVNYAKDEMNLSELNAGVHAENIYSIRILEKCGFKKTSQIEKNGFYFLYGIEF